MFKMIVTTANYDAFEDDFIEGMDDTALAKVEQNLQDLVLRHTSANAEDLVTILCNDQFDWLAHYLRFENQHCNEGGEYERQALLANYAYLTMLPDEPLCKLREQEHEIAAIIQEDVVFESKLTPKMIKVLDALIHHPNIADIADDMDCYIDFEEVLPDLQMILERLYKNNEDAIIRQL